MRVRSHDTRDQAAWQLRRWADRPKDALNEFVSNAADEDAEAGPAWRGGRIRVVLRRRGRRHLPSRR